MKLSNGLYREVEIYDDIVMKYQRFIDKEDAEEYDSEYRFDMVKACQRNELGFWNEFRNNGALCPILAGSNEDCIYMKRAITQEDCEEELLATGFYLSGQDSVALKLALENPEDMFYDVGYIIALGRDLASLVNTTIHWTGFIDGLNEIYRKNRNAYRALMEDMHGGNIGILDGNLVIIDYGCIDPVY